MVHYFAARGFSANSPRFPMVAVVFPRHGDFLRHAANEGVSIDSSVLGYYTHVSNRILLYDVTADQQDESRWFVNAETIIHEAAHQTAFNTGIHSRFAFPPRWLAEGIGTMFEARGVWDSRENTELKDRVNGSQMQAYRQFFPQGLKAESIAELISQDRYFQQNTDAAYALSWAITFYLAERVPRSLADYLKLTASRPEFELYSGPQRQRDFVHIFGNNLTMLGAHIDRFLKDLN